MQTIRSEPAEADFESPNAALIERLLARDLRGLLDNIGPYETRALIRLYYAVQKHRIAAQNESRSVGGEQNLLIAYLSRQLHVLEDTIKRALSICVQRTKTEPSLWLQSITGIGPVIAVGLLAHIDITKTPSPSSLWRFAGLDPEVRWENGKKRPWNADLKVLCYKAGESFVKQSTRDSDYYGHEYLRRKDRLWARNTAGEFTVRCAEFAPRFAALPEQSAWYRGHYTAETAILAMKLPDTRIAILANGKLMTPTGIPMFPPGHIHAMARREVVKLFLSHFWTVLYEDKYGTDNKGPYIIKHGGHVHYIPPPNWPRNSLTQERDFSEPV